MTDQEIKELATKMRATLRREGLMPAYTDESKKGQPPLLHRFLEIAIREHVVPLVK